MDEVLEPRSSRAAAASARTLAAASPERRDACPSCGRIPSRPLGDHRHRARPRRPADFRRAARRGAAARAPSAPGTSTRRRPRSSPTASRTTRRANAPGWRVRVVPNKFPALRIEGELDRRGQGLYDLMNGVGAHEVIIESPRPRPTTLAELPRRRVEDVVRAYRERMLDLKRDPRFRYVMVFKNHGARRGRAAEHTHSQLIAMPIVPQTSRDELARRAPTSTTGSAACSATSCSRRRRSAAAWCSRASTSWPSRRSRRACRSRPGSCRAATRAASSTRRRRAARPRAGAADASLRGSSGAARRPAVQLRPAHRAVRRRATRPYYHWHIEIMPTLPAVGGSDWGTGST